MPSVRVMNSENLLFSLLLFEPFSCIWFHRKMEPFPSTSQSLIFTGKGKNVKMLYCQFLFHLRHGCRMRFCQSNIPKYGIHPKCKLTSCTFSSSKRATMVFCHNWTGWDMLCGCTLDCVAIINSVHFLTFCLGSCVSVLNNKDCWLKDLKEII